MITCSIIKKSQLEGVLRLDAEYYQPEYLQSKNLLLKSKPVLLKDVAVITTGSAYSSEEIGESFDLPIARIGDVVNKIENNNWIKLSDREFKKFHSRKIKDKDILLSMTGDPPDVGKCNLITFKNDEVFAFNQRVAKLTAKINPHYLFAYLSTEIARLQTERNALGIRQRNLGIDDLRNTLIFVPGKQNQELVSGIIKNYLSELENSKLFYSQAENLLLDELGLKDFENEESLFNIVNISEVKKINRIDADYFQPEFYKTFEKIEKYKNGYSLVGKEFNQLKGNFKKEKEKLYNYIEISDVDISNGAVNYNQLQGEELPANAKIKFGARQLITSKVRPNRGATAILENHNGFIGSGAFVCLTERGKFNLETLQVYLKTKIIRNLLLRYNTGTSYPVINDEDILNLKIPIVKIEIQQKIADLVKKSHQARKKAKELLEEAKTKVEKLIENK
ncbi:MAG: restriction endonuclease subunit S [Candidatus Staskawiczbacteria bacterium]|nr:restriction endonuclease subunit S [Candidatus Staskawiczbacteria bacterium]